MADKPPIDLYIAAYADPDAAAPTGTVSSSSPASE
jgi:hypothetical protein